MNRDPHIIFISTALSRKLADWLSPADLEQIKMITDFTALCSTKKQSHRNQSLGVKIWSSSPPKKRRVSNQPTLISGRNNGKENGSAEIYDQR